MYFTINFSLKELSTIKTFESQFIMGGNILQSFFLLIIDKVVFSD
jgi:hypothetical protein